MHLNKPFFLLYKSCTAKWEINFSHSFNWFHKVRHLAKDEWETSDSIRFFIEMQIENDFNIWIWTGMELSIPYKTCGTGPILRGEERYKVFRCQGCSACSKPLYHNLTWPNPTDRLYFVDKIRWYGNFTIRQPKFGARTKRDISCLMLPIFFTQK